MRVELGTLVRVLALLPDTCGGVKLGAAVEVRNEALVEVVIEVVVVGSLVEPLKQRCTCGVVDQKMAHNHHGRPLEDAD